MLFGAAYVGVAWVCDTFFRFPVSPIAVLWPPSALTLAVLLRSHRADWPVLLGFLWLGAMVEVLLLGLGLPLAIGWGLAVALEPLVGASLMQARLRSPLALARRRDVLGLIGFGALLAPAVSGVVGGAFSTLLLGRPFLQEWFYWAASGAVSVLLLAPLLLWLLVPHPRALRRRLRPGRVAEAVVLGGLALGVMVLFYAGWARPPLSVALLYTSVPLVLWAALRFGLWGTSAVTAVVAAVAAWAGVRGTSPLPALGATPSEQVLGSQAFLALVGLSGLLLAATLSELQWAVRAQRSLADAGALLSNPLQLDATLERVAQRLVPALAGACSIFLESSDGALHASANASPGMRPGLQRLLRGPLHLPSRPWPQGGPRSERVTAHAGALLVPRLSPGLVEALVGGPVPQEEQGELSSCALLLQPIRSGGRTVGQLVLAACSQSCPFDERHLALSEALARRLASAMEQARLYREQQEAVRVRDEFLAIASHELKTPVTPLTLQLALLERRVEEGRPIEPAQLAGPVRRMRHSLERMRALIEDMLDATRVASGRLVLHHERVSLSALVRDVASAYAAQSPRHALTLEADGDTEVWVRGDSDRLEQVLANLVDNALKYSPLGGAIRVRLWTEAGEAHVAVQDQGIGIPAEEQAQLFDRFFRARNSSSRHYGGLGLGLYICRDIAERHGGHVRVQSAPGQGSTFTVDLPLLEVTAAPQRVELARSDAAEREQPSVH